MPERHPHRAKDDQLIFVVSGTCRVRAGDTDAVLSRDDTAFLPRRVPHVVDVLGDQPLELFITYRPRFGRETPIPPSSHERSASARVDLRRGRDR